LDDGSTDDVHIDEQAHALEMRVDGREVRRADR
jgi:hypothetical protein